MHHKIRLHSMASTCLVLVIIFVCFAGMGNPYGVRAQGDDPSPPAEPVRLIFIHHSTGENWLTDGYGDLGIALGENNYFVSDTNYGWGPDGIGDRTDIINWPEWFRSDASPRYMEALYTENGQNSSYTRNLSNPGGENQIVMFKSCFPNSNLEGNPDDPPTPGLDFTVGNAKYIYNDLLAYFSTRPDKLFVVVTAPPVQDPSLARNARAFNTWLMQDWLQENNYALNNVAVFDFYNVLTHPDNHHRFEGGRMQYVTHNGNNTSFYPTSADDDHPNPEGSRKATEEFVPLLNVFYNRWRSGAPPPPPPAEDTPPAGEDLPPEAETQAPGAAPIQLGSDLIDDFDSGTPEGTPGWEAFDDEAGETQIECSPAAGEVYSGENALYINYSIAPEGWATCALMYDQHQDWSPAAGLSFYAHSSQPGLVFDVHTYRGVSGALEGYTFPVETTQEMVDGWGLVEIPWEMVLGVEWEAQAGTPFNPDEAAGMAFGFGTAGSGEIWIDDVRLMEAVLIAPEATSEVQEPTEIVQPGIEEDTPEVTSTPEEEEDGGGGLCPLSPALAVVVGAAGLWVRKRRN